MNDIKIFENEQFGKIRIAGTSDKPLFCLIDVARALEYSNPSKAVIDHCKGVTVLETPTNGGVQNIKFGTEGQVYRLVLKAKTQKAEDFQDWVTDEVLPSIRKTGQYNMFKVPQSFAEALRLAADQQEKIEAQQKQLIEQEPKVNFANAMLTSSTSCLVANLQRLLLKMGLR